MSQTITLKHPIKVNGDLLGALTLRRPKVKDMLAADKTQGSDAEREIAMFANLCEQEPRTIEELDLADYQELQVVYQGFLS